MHCRERGAAHVNIFFFLVTLVLFLAALGFGYIQLTENNDIQARNQALEARNAQLEANALLVDHYLEDLRRVVGEAGTYEGRDGFTYEGDPEPLENVSLPGNVRVVMADFARETNIPESTATPVSSLLSQAKSTLSSKDELVSDLQSQVAAMQAQVDEMRTTVAEVNRNKDQEVSRLTQNIADLQQSTEDKFRQFENTIEGLRSEVRRRGEQLDREKEERAGQVLALERDLNQLTGHNAALAQKLTLVNPPYEPDGRVIQSSQAAGRAWIDLGRRDMLPRGTVFEIVDPRNSQVKARGRVIDLQRDRAELELFDVRDRFDPVVQGDLVRNDLYSPNVRRNIYLMGRFSHPLTKPVVRTILEELGNTVVDEVKPGVDLIIVGGDTLNEDASGFTPIEETEEYEKALQLNIEMAPVNKIRDFLELSTD